MSHASKNAATPPAKMRYLILVLLEVALLTLLLPLARASFKHLAPEGVSSATILQMGSGVLIIAPIVYALLILCRKDLKVYGITLAGWRDGLKIGVLLSLLCAVVVVATWPIIRRAGVSHFTGWEPRGQMIALGIAVPGLVLFAWIMRNAQSITKHIPTPLACAGLAGLWATPLILVGYFDRPFGPALVTASGSVFVHGLGEEFIFRGYIQSRLNEVLGRPFCMGGIQFGWGLFIASFLFGVVHIFNGCDFIAWRFDPQWTWGFSAFLTGMIFGYLREKTGSILSGALFHGNNDAWALIVLNLG